MLVAHSCRVRFLPASVQAAVVQCDGSRSHTVNCSPAPPPNAISLPSGRSAKATLVVGTDDRVAELFTTRQVEDRDRAIVARRHGDRCVVGPMDEAEARAVRCQALRPQALEQMLDRDRLSGARQHHGQDATLLRTADCDGGAVDHRFHRPEDSVAHTRLQTPWSHRKRW